MIDHLHRLNSELLVRASRATAERLQAQQRLEHLGRSVCELTVLACDVADELRELARRWWMRPARRRLLAIVAHIDRHTQASVDAEWRDVVWARIRAEERKP